MIRYNTDQQIYYSTIISKDQVRSGFATRTQGDGRDNKNIQNFLAEENIAYRTLVDPEQIHSTNVDLIRKPQEGIIHVEETDGIITRESGVALTIATADCIPAMFADHKKGIIGIAHHGWRGTL